MKKIVALLLALIMVLSMTACGKKDSGTDKPETSNTPTAATSGDTNPAVEGSGEAEEVKDDAFTHTFTQYGNARIKIVGAEALTGDRGDELLRIYYDYTNTDTDGPSNGHRPDTALEFLSVTQDGEELNGGLHFSGSSYQFRDGDESAVPEDFNSSLIVQPGCTNRETFAIRWNPDGGIVKVSCYIVTHSAMIVEDQIEPFEFEIDPGNLMGAPEPFELPAITEPTYTSGMSASGELDWPIDSEVSINGIELTKDRYDKDVVQVNLTVTNKDEEEEATSMIAAVKLYQDGVGLHSAVAWMPTDWNATDSSNISPGETVDFSAFFYPRTKSPVEAVIENPNSKKGLRLGACFDLKSLYDAAEAASAAADAAAADAAAAASAADKATMTEMVGTWELVGDWPDRITFNADLTGAYDFMGDLDPFTYTVTDGVLQLTYDNTGNEVKYEISVSGDDMVLTDTIQGEQTFVRAD